MENGVPDFLILNEDWIHFAYINKKNKKSLGDLSTLELDHTQYFDLTDVPDSIWFAWCCFESNFM